MRFKSSLAALCTSSALWLNAGCIDVTCAERGTCPSEGDTKEDAATPGETQRDGAVSGSTHASSEAGSGHTDDSSTTAPTYVTTSSDAASSGDAAVTGTSLGPSGTSSSTGLTDSVSETQTSTPTQTTGDQSQCEAGPCGCGAECSTAPEAGPRTECSPDEIAACSEATPICVFDLGSPVCLGCVTDEHCADPTPVCTATQCQLCDLGTHRGCDDPTPYCVSTSPTAPLDGGTTSSDATSISPTSNDASAPSSAASQTSPIVDAGEATSDAVVEPTRACVECRTGADCTEGEPFCIEGACEQCQVDTDCTDPNASRCDATTHQCSGCTELGACSRFAATPACNLDTGSCVECTAAETSACEDYACQTIPGDGQFTCSAQPLGDAQSCNTCVSDAACASGNACVRENFDDQDTEWVCLPEEPDDSCATNADLISTMAEAVSADGQLGNYCKPAQTTCAGYRHFGSEGIADGPYCQSDDDCGLPNVTDGKCLSVQGSNTVRACSYPCLLDFECPANSDCDSFEGGDFRACTID